jgi:hypothetical protein
MVLNKYSAALLQIAIIVIGAYSILQTPVSAIAAWGLVVLAAQAVVTYLVPVLTGRWAGGFKTGAAIVIAVVGTLIPLIAQGGHLLPSQVAILILSGLNALAAEIGVQIRLDTASTGALVGHNNVTTLPGDDGLANNG